MSKEKIDIQRLGVIPITEVSLQLYILLAYGQELV